MENTKVLADKSSKPPLNAEVMFNTVFKISNPPTQSMVSETGFVAMFTETETLGFLKPYLKNGATENDIRGKRLKVSFLEVTVGKQHLGYYPDAPYTFSLANPYHAENGTDTAFVMAALLPITPEFLSLSTEQKMTQLKLQFYNGLKAGDLCIPQLQARIEDEGTVFEYVHGWDLLLDNLVEYAISTKIKRIAIPKPENIYWLGEGGKPRPSYQSRYVDFIKAYFRKLNVDTNRHKDSDLDQGIRFELNSEDPNFTFINIIV